MKVPLLKTIVCHQLDHGLMEERIMFDRRRSFASCQLSAKHSPSFGHQEAVLRMQTEAFPALAKSLNL